MVAAGHGAEDQSGRGRFAFLAKLTAWLGRSAPESAASGGARPAGSGSLGAAEQAPPLDAPTLAQWLWGAGFHIPGGEEHVLDLVKSFALNPAMSMLDVGTGLGGGARAIATKFATYVTGLESDDALARRGMEMSTLQGMQKRAPVSVYDPETIELRAGAFDRVLGRETTYLLADKERFLRVLALSLKERGELLLTDYVVEPKIGPRPELEIWGRQQKRPPHLWALPQYADCLKRLGFDIRVAEDTTHDTRRLIVVGWAQMLDTVDLRGLPKQHLLAIVDEAERWVRTIAALDSGALKTYRFYALVAAGRTKPR